MRSKDDPEGGICEKVVRGRVGMQTTLSQFLYEGQHNHI